MNYYAIIVAGGSGNRMNNTIPKQFMILDGRPILMHSIEKFYNCGLDVQIIVVLSPTLRSEWQRLCKVHIFSIPHQIADSGEQRFHSVKNGLTLIKTNGLVAIHDAARPLTSTKLIYNSFIVAEKHGSSVTAVTPTDSIRKLNKDQSTTSLLRNELYVVQTPQTFRTELLKTAYQMKYEAIFTDDASVVEASGFNIHLTEGERSNIKITYPEDIIYASMLLNVNKEV